VSLAPDPVRIRCLAGAFERAGLHAATRAGTDVRRVSETLVDVTVRAFR
jgi:hypothetical protein